MTKATWTAGQASTPPLPALAVSVTRARPAPAWQVSSPKAQILSGETEIPSDRLWAPSDAGTGTFAGLLAAGAGADRTAATWGRAWAGPEESGRASEVGPEPTSIAATD